MPYQDDEPRLGSTKQAFKDLAQMIFWPSIILLLNGYCSL